MTLPTLLRNAASALRYARLQQQQRDAVDRESIEAGRVAGAEVVAAREAGE